MDMHDLATTLAALGRGLPAWLGVMTLWTGGLLALAWLADWALRRVAEPGLRIALYAVVLVRVALPVDWQTPLGVLDDGAPPSLATNGPSAIGAVAPAGQAFVVVAEAASVETAPVSAPIDALGLGLLAVYLAGALGLGFVVMRRLRRLRRVLAASTATTALHGVPVHAHADAGPMAVGLRRPTIVVPHALLESTQTEVLDAVLRHELAHVRHRDGVSALAMALLCAIAWPLVPVWIAVARVRLLMELRADAAAVRACAPPAVRGYRRLLLDLAQQRWPAHVLAPGLDPVAALRARLGAMATRPRAPWLLQLAFVGPLAITLLVVAGRRSDPGVPAAAVADSTAPVDVTTAPVAEPAPVDAVALPYPHCREHAGIEIPLVGDRDTQTLMRTRVQVLAKMAARRSPDRMGMLGPIADSLFAGPQQLDGIARAEARYVIGLGHAANGRMAEAAEHISEASWEAALLRYDLVAAEAAAAMVVVLHRGGPQAQDEALSWSRHAEAAIRNSGQAGPMAIEMHRALAVMAERRGDAERAAAHRTEAEAIDAACEVVSAFGAIREGAAAAPADLSTGLDAFVPSPTAEPAATE
jgi:beta-lactamase regulating signal transducer with metallopeptidase domain